MNRRDFLIASGALLSQPMLPAFAVSDNPTGKLYFGYGSTGIGTKVGKAAADLMYQVNPNFDYRFINEPGRNTVAATELVRQSLSDGNTLLQVNGTIMSLFTCLYRNLPYDPLTDFVPITFLGEYSYMLVVGPLVDRSVKTLDDYVEWVKENPEYRNFGTVLYGSESHLAGLELSYQKKIALRAQAYGGTSLMTEDLLDGVLAAGFMVTGNADSAIKSGRLRVIGVCSEQRHSPWPEVPTLAEQGVVGMDFRGWYGWVAPSSIRLNRLIELSDATQEMHLMSEFKAMQQTYSLKTLDLSPAEIQQRIHMEIKKCEALYQKFQLSRVDYQA
ncbi:Bug family tripartite tricarboxylate transporter substrate binding protein [Marinomonas sp. TW1]|uniref:Bug family tripartite tricarboxylate transporter substrate binding protein n=1 Tax=Marinomonas sp. TW1 TaxID=1561203 RepID=UPI0007AF1AD3|nr:tripartite tricarboxylate transporter substrate binding protein [Marinomonas sp. TW1]KZN14601.1 hypothetical protein OA79_04855 [Marinomonas sp. TW1]